MSIKNILYYIIKRDIISEIVDCEFNDYIEFAS